jgi:phosphoglycerate dehydrogenase-like enzyme
MRVLLTAVAYERYWAGLDRSGLEPLLFGRDGQIRTESGQPVAAEAADPEVAWGTSDLYLDGAPLRPYFGFLSRCASLRWFQSAGAGFDGPAYAALASRGIRVSNAHVNSLPIAEYVLRAVLDHFQGGDQWRAAQAAAEWRSHEFREVHGSTWLIIGLGAIGSGVARLARAFGAATIGCRRHPSGEEITERTVMPDQLFEVIELADVVVLAAAANSSNLGLVDAAFLAAMKPRSVLVNVARGSLVDEGALVTALDRGTPEAALLDVFENEPLPADHPLWRHPAVKVTPHNAAKGTGRYQRQADLFSENLARYLAGRPLINDVTPAILSGG